MSVTLPDSVLDQLHDALANVHDPSWASNGEVCALLGYPAGTEALRVQSTLLQWIANMEPGPDAHPSSHTRRVYDLLESRYILGLTQDETAERMHVSRSTVQRLQREAIHALALAIASEHSQEPVPTDKWKTQTQREIALLESKTASPRCNIEEVVRGVLSLQLAAARRKGPSIRVGHLQPGLTAAVHPMVLRQSLITAIGRIRACAACSEITVFAGTKDGGVEITLVVREGNTRNDPQALLQGILLADAMHAEVETEGEHLFLHLTAPAADKATILVVDDNPDIAEFYRRALEGSEYAIAQTRDGGGLLALVKRLRPAIILLDVMLPGIDGWELLMLLHDSSDTRSIPVIVCSVVRERDLALSLGASGYLAKPVDPHSLREALDKALERASA
jgi:CheY-like chemotaxis protein/AraC-like DNA-binding protein